ncbi:hypothetical protein NQ314_012158 [Rhamnusium bicolor]|uniref:C2H2-type domain-containing protein n=1 Tax=Rhamnusium bicolor TaxID=1586634 RepID=A0AAV8XCT4_9CUCU|nr:hypothetical protein NQ314_012158 [Rhamnusium bicolor]
MHDEPSKLEKEIEQSKEAETPKANVQSEPAEPDAKPADQTILAQFFANLLGSQNKRDKKTALYSLISTFSDSFIPMRRKNLKKTEQKPEEEKVVELAKDTAPDEAPPEASLAKMSKGKARKRIRRISSGTAEEKSKDEELGKSPEPEEDLNNVESVVVTVGERIKSRKRTSVTPPKPRKKIRTELDMLHEDIQDMFIRDGVLTASGKRMCRMLKSDPNALSTAHPNSPASEEPLKVRKKPGPKPKPKPPNAAEVKAMKSVRVIIPKIPDSTLEQKEDSNKRNLRRFTRSTTYAESDDDSPLRLEKTAVDDDSVVEEGSIREDDSDLESIDSEKDKSSVANDPSQKSKKKKKQASFDESTETANKKDNEDHDESILNDSDIDKSFVEPDRNCYIDFVASKSHICKLCTYQGKYITTHYKTAHPDSEILTSRFAPNIASAAIVDSDKNLVRYENIMRVKGGAKFQFCCRFCEFTTNVPPTLFYDHITTHTGEYRHICPICEFSASSGKTLKSHLNNIHQNAEKRVARKSYGQTIIFGYMCGECNYVQLCEKNVEEHINIFHLEKPIVYKVNMSTYLDPEIEKIAVSEPASDSSEPPLAVIEKGEHVMEQQLITPKQKKSTAEKVVDEKEMLPPQRKKSGPKPCPKSKKKIKEKKIKKDKPVVDFGTSSDSESVTSKGNDQDIRELARVEEKSSPITRRRLTREVSIEDEPVITGRSRRAAKDKATEKLRCLMEAVEASPRKKSLGADVGKKHDEKVQNDKAISVKSSEEQNKDKDSTKKDNKIIEAGSKIIEADNKIVDADNKTIEVDNKTAEAESKTVELNSTAIEVKKKAVEMDSKAVEADNKVASKDNYVAKEELKESNIPKEEVKPVVKKEVEMNVFTCKTDLQEENKKIEQERLHLMQELNKSVGSRTSLNFVDKLCNRLSKNDVIVKQEPRDDLTDSLFARDSNNKSPLVMPVLEKNLPTTSATTSTSIKAPPNTGAPTKKPVLAPDDIRVSNSTYDVTQKNDKIITDMIQKLKGKLATTVDDNIDSPITVDDNDYDSEGPPPLTHVNELPNVKPSDGSTKTLLIGGLVRVIKNSESLMFSCLVPPCVFSTENKDVFQNHCKEAHKAYNLRTSTLCEMCGFEIVATAECTLIENLFKHTITEHADFINNDPNTDIFVKPANRVLRIRKLSGDATEGDKEENNKENQVSVNTTAVSEVAVNETTSEEPPATMVELDMSDDNPFPFKIAGVMSLAEPQPPPLAPIAKSSMQLSPGAQLIVKEAKLTQAEMSKPRKTQKAMAKFIASVSDLYKCPHYYCLFSTNFRDFLDRHLKAHKVEHDVMIPCVYCDMKTPWEHVPMHIDIRHAHCRFACTYCLYRAVVKEYVFIHQDQMHPNNDYSVIGLPQPKYSKKFAIADVKIDPKNLCEPFRCTKVCNVEFLFENEFKRHLQEVHKNNFVQCGYKNCSTRVQGIKMTNHWAINHGVSVYQCGFCRMSCNDIKRMYHHFAQSHQGHHPDILIRMLTPMEEDRVMLGFTSEAFKSMRKIVALPNNILKENKVDVSPAVDAAVPTVVPTTVPYGIPPTSKPVTMPFTKATIQMVSSLKPLIPASSTGTSRTITLEVIPAQEKQTTDDTSNDQNGSEDVQESDLNVEPVEHINLGEDNNASTVDEADTGDVDPLSLEMDTDLNDAAKSTPDAFSSGDESDGNKVEKSKKSIKRGLLSYQLYRCAFCDISFSNSNDFKKHVSRSLTCRKDDATGRPFVCVHCEKNFKNTHVLTDHIQCHGIMRFSCSLCGNKFPTANQARSHIKNRHNIPQTTLSPLNPLEANPDIDEYVISPKLVLQPSSLKETPANEPSTESSATENVYTPDQVDRIPMRHILSSSIKCGLCSYSTKVRTNMVRHLHFHSEEKNVPDTAPVNPVPCLEKNEKMFDKMVNLASSSHNTSRMGGAKTESKEKEADNLPEYVPTHCRYVCCAQGCSYICPEEGNLRHHLIALHDSETSFTCVHCKSDLTPTDADSLIKHFKLHGLQLYKCQYCNVIHYLKHKVEKHVSDVHLDLPVKVITVRLLEAEPKDVTQEPSSSGVQNQSTSVTSKVMKPWRCCMCKYRTGSQEGIQNHVLEKHEIDSQFKCALCTYKNNDTEMFTDHFKEAHNNQPVDFIYVYRKMEEEKEKETEVAFDTTPLWQRDRPRVRHIRGILFDDSTPSPTKSPKKPAKVASTPAVTPTPGPSGVKSVPASPGPSTSKNSNIDLSIESVANGTADILQEETSVSDDFFDTVNKLVKDSSEDIAKAKDSVVIIIDDEDENKDGTPLAKNKDNKNYPMAKKQSFKTERGRGARRKQDFQGERGSYRLG